MIAGLPKKVVCGNPLRRLSLALLICAGGVQGCTSDSFLSEAGHNSASAFQNIKYTRGEICVACLSSRYTEGDAFCETIGERQILKSAANEEIVCSEILRSGITGKRHRHEWVVMSEWVEGGELTEYFKIKAWANEFVAKLNESESLREQLLSKVIGGEINEDSVEVALHFKPEDAKRLLQSRETYVRVIGAVGLKAEPLTFSGDGCGGR